MDLAFPILGFVVGVIVGVSGMGGGAITTAALIGLFGVPPLTAVGTDLLFAGATKIVGTSVHARNGNVNWRVVALLACGSLPATALVLAALSQLDTGHADVDLWVTRIIGLAILLAAATIIVRRQLKYIRIKSSPHRPPGAAITVGTVAWTLLLGFVLGALVTISSVGAGAVGVAVLFVLYPRMTAARIVGSDIAHAVPLTLIAGLGHALIGSVDWQLLGLLLIGSVPGIYVGSQVAHHLPEKWLVAGLAIVLTGIGLRLLFAGAH